MTAIETALELDDATFLKEIEAGSLDHKYFSHIGHMRLAWLYLGQMEEEAAVQATCGTIRNYARQLGVPDKFHLTLTDAFVRIMAQRSGGQDSWQSFLSDNHDLVDDAKGVLGKYFSQQVLASEKARVQLIEPDIAPFGL